MSSSLLKVVYFDESSVIDYLQIFHKGKVEQTLEKVSKLDGEGKADGDVEVKDDPNLLQFLVGLKVNAGVGGSGSLGINRVKTTLIKNSLLFDFYNIVSRQRMHKHIKKLTDYKLQILPDSMAYYASIAPLTEMMEGKSQIDSDVSIKVDKMNTAIKALKGYFEIIGEKGSEEVIFRFNLDSFRNNYRLQDLTKMSLAIYAVEVGKGKKSDLNFDRQINANSSGIDENDFDGFDKLKPFHDKEIDDKELPIYDVYLAGVLL